MLVLGRAIGEIISIGNHITVRILEVNGTQVKLGVEAPAEVKVHRSEVYQKMLNQQASRPRVPEPNP
ncbi:carbon storage regulator CsrA [Pseudomonas sp. CCM 7891]|uniref:Translational regulator CsrA n=1 Tax=Pseudomonas karstica TaxID=1055468 RepID=A0A7X2RYH7_9PSED|nr:carbon storage regulator CsrA [Pseudomonas karstica]MTD22405.1 carbon storage regulator CsrA [Pseudomonas karstica]